MYNYILDCPERLTGRVFWLESFFFFFFSHHCKYEFVAHISRSCWEYCGLMVFANRPYCSAFSPELCISDLCLQEAKQMKGKFIMQCSVKGKITPFFI